MPSLADIFPLIRVVNLPDRKDRLQEISAQLQVLGAPFRPGQVEVYPAVRPTELAGFPSLGARGCFESHLEILRDARERDVESVLILEDDLEVLPADVPRLAALLASIPEPWGILYPGHIQALEPVTHPRWTAFNGPLGTSHCYAVHRSAMEALIGYLEACLSRPSGDPVGGPMHYDGALTMFRSANPQHRTYIAQPSLGRQRSSRSDVSVRRLEQVPGIRQAAALARRVRRSLRRDPDGSTSGS